MYIVIKIDYSDRNTFHIYTSDTLGQLTYKWSMKTDDVVTVLQSSNIDIDVESIRHDDVIVVRMHLTEFGK